MDDAIGDNWNDVRAAVFFRVSSVSRRRVICRTSLDEKISRRIRAKKLNAPRRSRKQNRFQKLKRQNYTNYGNFRQL